MQSKLLRTVCKAALLIARVCKGLHYEDVFLWSVADFFALINDPHAGMMVASAGVCGLGQNAQLISQPSIIVIPPSHLPSSFSLTVTPACGIYRCR
jgi:hypothetical protein